MLKLYRKNEILFAVLCIVVYVVVCGNLRTLGDDSPAMLAGLAAIAAALLAFIATNGLSDKYGLDRWATNSRRLLHFLPLWLVTSVNLWAGIEPHYQGVGLACALASMALVGLVEELVFRGLLFKALLADGNATKAIVISSVTFGVGHIVNLLTGHATVETLAQVVYAIALGFVFTLVFYRSDSLWPGIVAHSLIDVFSKLAGEPGEAFNWICIAFIIVVSVAYSIYLARLEAPGADG